MASGTLLFYDNRRNSVGGERGIEIEQITVKIKRKAKVYNQGVELKNVEVTQNFTLLSTVVKFLEDQEKDEEKDEAEYDAYCDDIANSNFDY